MDSGSRRCAPPRNDETCPPSSPTACSAISTSCAPSAPTRPASTARPLAGRHRGAQMVRRAMHRGRARDHHRRHRQHPGKEQGERRARRCPARIWKRRTMPAGSTARSAASTRWKPRARSRRRAAIPASTSWCSATRRGISARSSARSRSPGVLKEEDIDKATQQERRHADARCAARRPAMRDGRASTIEPERYKAFFEAHIEQGDTLEMGELRIGVVTAIVAIWQYGITVTGEQNHAGTTSMTRRRDAGLALVQAAQRDRQALSGNLRPAHGVDHRAHHARSRQPQHHSGPRRGAVPVARRRSGGARPAARRADTIWSRRRTASAAASSSSA